MKRMKKIKAFALRNIGWINFINIVLLIGWATLISVNLWGKYIPCEIVFTPMTLPCSNEGPYDFMVYGPLVLLSTVLALGFSVLVKYFAVRAIVFLGTLVILSAVLWYYMSILSFAVYLGA